MINKNNPDEVRKDTRTEIDKPEESVKKDNTMVKENEEPEKDKTATIVESADSLQAVGHVPMPGSGTGTTVKK